MGRRVLVADDSPTIQRRAKDTLAAEGIDVVTVSNGVAAIKKLPDVKPLVVLADISMPGRDGYEVCDFVKSAPEWRHVPVLLVVGADEPYDEPRGARVRADGRIKKPFDKDELVSTVMKFLSQAEAAAPPPPAPAPAPAPVAVSEPVDEPPELYEKKGMSVEALPEGVAFGEAVPEAPPVFPPAVEPPAVESPVSPFGDAEAAVAPAPEVFEQSPFPAVEAPPGESFIPAAEQAEAPAPVEETPVAAEPVLVEDVAEPVPETQAPPSMEGTMMFRSPAQIAEPVLSDEVTPEPEPVPVEPPPPLAAEPEPPPEPPPPPPPPEIHIPTASLDSFSLTDAARGNVRFAQPAVPPGSAPALDANAIHSIVRRVVAKMSPPALSPEIIEQMSRKFADEIIAEMAADTSHSS